MPNGAKMLLLLFLLLLLLLSSDRLVKLSDSLTPKTAAFYTEHNFKICL